MAKRITHDRSIRTLNCARNRPVHAVDKFRRLPDGRQRGSLRDEIVNELGSFDAESTMRFDDEWDEGRFWLELLQVLAIVVALLLFSFCCYCERLLRALDDV